MGDNKQSSVLINSCQPLILGWLAMVGRSQLINTLLRQESFVSHTTVKQDVWNIFVEANNCTANMLETARMVVSCNLKISRLNPQLSNITPSNSHQTRLPLLSRSPSQRSHGHAWLSWWWATSHKFIWCYPRNFVDIHHTPNQENNFIQKML